MKKRVIITICGRAGSKGLENKNLLDFCGRPLVYYTLSAAELFTKARPDLEIDLVLNTDSPHLKELVLAKYPEAIALHRPPKLAGDDVAKLRVFQQSVREMEERHGKLYDYHLDLDITSPLRRLEDVQGCFEALEAREDLDLVMSAVESRRNPFMNVAVRRYDHVEPAVPSHFVARQQAPACYDLNASIYAFRRDFLARNTSGMLWDGKCDVFEMLDTAVLDIDSREDFELMELIAWHIYESRPQYAAVRDNIRQ
ncbi:MAG: acylneuraminate cytidylyltransferase family protein [Ruminococcaceae bacterium]|mgnify:CR=1 FL=1|nr:acylneuraminate cytidylyltransferase family protein [Oscillospiraceae bacterium]